MAAPNQVGDNVPVQTATALPRAFGNYLLFDRIGRGGMAEIFLTRTHTEFGGSRRVVIKEVLPELSKDASFTAMLVREAKLAARLNHRNIAQVLDLGRESGRLFIAMEYVEGYDLNLVWFGVVVIKLLEIGLITPPIGLNVFVIKSVAPSVVTLESVFKGACWFLILDLVVLLAILLIPALSLAIPRAAF